MNTDNFTDAARAEAELQFPTPLYSTAWSESEVQAKRALWESGAQWARDYPAAQEPTDAEVEAAKAVLDSVEYADEPQSIRAALRAARAARRDEEKR